MDVTRDRNGNIAHTPRTAVELNLVQLALTHTVSAKRTAQMLKHTTRYSLTQTLVRASVQDSAW
jgi:hypothetical protein